MANNKKDNRNNNRGGRGLLNTVAFWTIIIIGICMLISAILGWANVQSKVVSIIQRVCFGLALVLVVFYSFNSAKNRKFSFFILYLIGAVFIIVGFVSMFF